MAKSAPPKGGSKGGKRFPRLTLDDAVKYAKRLVSKTHVSAQPENIILLGVFDSSGSTGKVRASGLKQFGLMKGKSKAYEATEMAIKIAASTPSDLTVLLQDACLTPPVFRTIYDTFHGDVVSGAKIRQHASTLGVHPDVLDKCVEYATASFQFAELAVSENGNWNFTSAQNNQIDENSKLDVEDVIEESAANSSDESLGEDGSADIDHDAGKISSTQNASVSVSISVDASLDTDKLERQLKLLKKYGAL